MLRRLLLPSIAPITPTEDVTMPLSGGLFSSVTFGASLGVTSAEVKDDDEFSIVVDAMFSDDTRRTFSIGTNEMTFEEGMEVQSLGTLSNGEEVRYVHFESSNVYNYLTMNNGYYYNIVSRQRAYTLEEMQETIDNITLEKYVEPEPEEPEIEGVEQVVTVESDDDMVTISKVTFGADLLIDRATCLQAQSGVVQIDAHFYGEEYDRTFMFTDSDMNYDFEDFGVTQDGASVKYKNDGGIYHYAWEFMDELNYQTIYIEMISGVELDIEDINFVIANMTIETKSRY